jgi:anti-sigma factor RsiW
MPRTGTPSSKISFETRGAFSAYTLEGPPERMMPEGRKARIASTDTVQGWISLYTLASRTRRAMSMVYWEPKSRIRIFFSTVYSIR